MRKILEKTHPLLATIPDEQWMNLLHQGKMHRYSYLKNQVIHLEGECCRGFEIVLTGEVYVERSDENGFTMIVSRFLPGDLLGGNLLFSKDPTYPMLVQAKEPTELLFLSKATTLELCVTNRAFLVKFLEGISDNATLLGNAIRNRVQIPLRQSLLRFLENESHRQGSSTILLTCSKKMLANTFGVARTSLSRMLQQLKHEGRLDFDRNTITLHAPSGDLN